MADVVSPEETGREEFEKWALERRTVNINRRRDGEYADRDTRWDWEVWQAAFEAGERKERESCAKLANAKDGITGDWRCYCETCCLIRGGESTT